MPPIMRAVATNAQILRLWQAYRDHCLAGRWLSAASTMAMIDAKLDAMQRTEHGRSLVGRPPSADGGHR